jgi:hypothetical protein
MTMMETMGSTLRRTVLTDLPLPRESRTSVHGCSAQILILLDMMAI